MARTRVTPTTSAPYVSICRLVITLADNSTVIYGTGWMIGSRTCVTAAHNVIPKRQPISANNTWVSKVVVQVAKDDSLSSSWPAYTGYDFRASSYWAGNPNGDDAWDYGAIVLPSAVDSAIGSLSYAVLTDTQLAYVNAVLTGYPDGTSPVPTNFVSYGMYKDTALTSGTGDHYVFHQCEASRGQTGSPLWLATGGSTVFGLHTRYDANIQSNVAVRITAAVKADLDTWKNP